MAALRVPINLVGNGLAAADVIGNVLNVGHRSGAGRHVIVAESEHTAIGAAGVVREDGFERRISLSSGAPLLAGVTPRQRAGATLATVSRPLARRSSRLTAPAPKPAI